MISVHHRQPFPRIVPWAAGILVTLTLIASGVARQTHLGTTVMAPSAAVEVRALRFADRPDGSIAVFREREDTVATIVPPGGDGFIRGVLRGLSRERKRNGIGVDEPYRLVRRADGRLTIADPSTRRRIDLGAFGPANYGAFARIFTDTAPPADAAAETSGKAASDAVTRAFDGGIETSDSIAREPS